MSTPGKAELLLKGRILPAPPPAPSGGLPPLRTGQGFKRSASPPRSGKHPTRPADSVERENSFLNPFNKLHH